MKIHWKDEFKRDYQWTESRLRKPVPFKKALAKAVQILQQGDDLADKYVVNTLLNRGPGWYDCYVYDDIIMIYKIEGQYVKLSRLGTPKDLEKER